ncbi:unnamed protein product, partial [Didymodactylos carnosus]
MVEIIYGNLAESDHLENGAIGSLSSLDNPKAHPLESFMNRLRIPMISLDYFDYNKQFDGVKNFHFSIKTNLLQTLAAFIKRYKVNRLYYVVEEEEGHIENQTIPIVLPCSTDDKERLKQSDSSILALYYNGTAVAIIQKPEYYEHRKEERCCRIFGICDREHPHIKMIMDSGDWLIGGELKVFERVRWNDGLDHFRLTPNQLRQRFYEIKVSLIKNSFLRLAVRIAQYQPVLDDDDNVLDRNKTVLAIFPSPMLYAGPREVQWHAKARTTAGVSFYIVGRDP